MYMYMYLSLWLQILKKKKLNKDSAKKRSIISTVKDTSSNTSPKGDGHETEPITESLLVNDLVLEGDPGTTEKLPAIAEGQRIPSSSDSHLNCGEEETSPQQAPEFRGYARKTKKVKTVHCPKCSRTFTSMKRLLQSHYDEETSTCKTKLQEDKNFFCPLCGRSYSSQSSLNSHYSDKTNTCKTTSDGSGNSIFSSAVTTALSTKKTSEEQLYAAITEVSVVWLVHLL